MFYWSCDIFKTLIGSHTVIHPTAAIIAEGAPIIIGDNNLIMEKVVIINKYNN